MASANVHYPHGYGVCPGCGRCRICGQPSSPAPYWPPRPYWWGPGMPWYGDVIYGTTTTTTTSPAPGPTHKEQPRG